MILDLARLVYDVDHGRDSQCLTTFARHPTPQDSQPTVADAWHESTEAYPSICRTEEDGRNKDCRGKDIGGVLYI